MEDEKTTLIDLSDTLREEGIEVPTQPRERAASTSADDVVITVEEEAKEEKVEAEPEKPTYRAFGWIRRK
jgi:hypothetical protein